MISTKSIRSLRTSQRKRRRLNSVRHWLWMADGIKTPIIWHGIVVSLVNLFSNCRICTEKYSTFMCFWLKKAFKFWMEHHFLGGCPSLLRGCCFWCQERWLHLGPNDKICLPVHFRPLGALGGKSTSKMNRKEVFLQSHMQGKGYHDVVFRWFSCCVLTFVSFFFSYH